MNFTILLNKKNFLQFFDENGTHLATWSLDKKGEFVIKKTGSILNGLAISRYKNGKIRLKIKLKDGEPIFWTEYLSDGRLKQKRTFYRQTLSSIRNYQYYDTGELKEILIKKFKYKNKKADVIEKIKYYKNGFKKSFERLVNGKYHGNVYKWYKNGVLKDKKVFMNGSLISKKSFGIEENNKLSQLKGNYKTIVNSYYTKTEGSLFSTEELEKIINNIKKMLANNEKITLDIKEMKDIVIESFKKSGILTHNYSDFSFLSSILFGRYYYTIASLMQIIKERNRECFENEIMPLLEKALNEPRVELKLRNYISNIFLIHIASRFDTDRKKIKNIFDKLYSTDVNFYRYILDVNGSQEYYLMYLFYKALSEVPEFGIQLQTNTFLNQYKNSKDPVLEEIHKIRNEFVQKAPNYYID